MTAENCGLFYEITKSIPDSVPAYWANDTLYTKQGRIDRNNRVREENKKNSEAYEDSVLTSMNEAGEYCKDHGGIVSRKGLSEYDFSKPSCYTITKKTLPTNFKTKSSRTAPLRRMFEIAYGSM